MDTGRYIKIERIKDSAAPIDDETKFAWEDDDYETVEEWVEYTADELEAMDEAERLSVSRERMEQLAAVVADQDAAICALYEMQLGGA